MIVPDAALPYISRHRFSRREPIGYEDSLREDFEMIAPYLPAKVGSILDIGCGMAGIDVLLKRRYPNARLLLLDGDGDEDRDGWNKRLEAFSSRAVAEELLEANGVACDQWLDVNTTEHLKADLVISLASWGYHYPLSTYRVSGYCIADLRKAQEKLLGTVIKDYDKRARCAWRQR